MLLHTQKTMLQNFITCTIHPLQALNDENFTLQY